VLVSDVSTPSYNTVQADAETCCLEVIWCRLQLLASNCCQAGA
jgi:hypothetical protein